MEGLLFRDYLPPSGLTHKSSGSRKQCEKCRGEPRKEHSGSKQKKAEEQVPSYQEMEALRAEIEQLKALVHAPPTPSIPRVVSWDSGEDEDDVMSTRASNSQFQACGGAFIS